VFSTIFYCLDGVVEPYPAAPLPQSSCAADTILTGINYLKGQAPVLALADDQYPEWLWTILDPKVWPEDGPGGKAERVQRRQENQRQIKDRNFMSTQ
jgi:large subunit ribosomal protein L54